jgi:hypothetical protein
VYQLLRFAALLLGIVAVTSCQIVADIESYEADPLPTKCLLPAPKPGGGRVRLAHVLPSDSAIDICVRTSGGTYGRPVLRSSGADKLLICGAGLKYSQVTVPFAVPTGLLDFKIVPATKTCSAPALAEKTGVEVTTDLIVTVAYMGPREGDGSPTVQAMYENTNAPPTQNRLTRYINAIADRQLDWGAGDGSETLPSVLFQPYLTVPMGFGQLPKKDQSSKPAAFVIDNYGYVSSIQSPIPTGAASAGSSQMVMLGMMRGAGSWTYYGIGYPGANSAWPVRGLICRDAGVSTDEDQRQDCTLTEVEMFRIDVVNAGLYGAFAAVESERGAAVIQKLAQRGAVSDFLCVSEVSRHDALDIPASQKAYTQEALKAAALAVDPGFKHFAMIDDINLDTQPDDPVDPAGNIPPPVTRIPCSAPVTQENLDRAYNCLINKCNSIPGSLDGVTAGGTNCYSQNCGASALGFLLFGKPEDHQCFNCIVLNGLSYMSWGKNRTRCTTEGRRPMAFEGKSTSMLLSRLPLRNIEKFVIPTSAFRRIAIYANVDLGLGNDIDVYCVHSPPLLGGNIPYTGAYGKGLDDHAKEWSEEQIFTNKKVIDWINRKSANRRAIIMGDWSSSSAFLDANGNVVPGPDGLPAVGDVTPETTLAMKEAFTEAIPQGYAPKCTRCPAGRMDELRNVYNVGVTDPMWNVRVYIKDPWGPNLTESAGLFFHEPADYVTYTTLTDFGPQGPVSDTWGFHVNIRR